MGVAISSFLVFGASQVGSPGPVIMGHNVADSGANAPGVLAGRAIRPVNHRAWAMIVAAFTTLVGAGTPTLQATAIIATCLAACQLVLHPLWTIGGETLAQSVAGRPGEKYLIWTLAALTVASVLFVLFSGGKS